MHLKKRKRGAVTEKKKRNQPIGIFTYSEFFCDERRGEIPAKNGNPTQRQASGNAEISDAHRQPERAREYEGSSQEDETEPQGSL